MSKQVPTHYRKQPIQPIEIIDAYGLDFKRGNALKYLLRAGSKLGEEKSDDLQKAMVPCLRTSRHRARRRNQRAVISSFRFGCLDTGMWLRLLPPSHMQQPRGKHHQQTHGRKLVLA